MAAEARLTRIRFLLVEGAGLVDRAVAGATTEFLASAFLRQIGVRDVKVSLTQRKGGECRAFQKANVWFREVLVTVRIRMTGGIGTGLGGSQEIVWLSLRSTRL
jgi:hypothetical protein